MKARFSGELAASKASQFATDLTGNKQVKGPVRIDGAACRANHAKAWSSRRGKNNSLFPKWRMCL
jgi:hypothetical protein